MRFLLFIFLIIYFPALSQPTGNKNLFLTNAVTSPRPAGFDWDALTPQSPTAYTNAGTVVIDAKSFTNLNTGVLSGDNIQVSGTGNLIFKNCYFGASIRNAVTIFNFTGTIRFENCLFVSNKVAIEVTTSTCTFQAENCQCINPWGAPLCKGQFFQSASATFTNSYIRGCAMKSYRGLASTEDWISLFSTNASSGSPFIIEDNLIQNGGPSISGGGIMLGDHGGSWAIVRNNKLNDPGNYQIAVSGGNNYVVENNLAYSTNTGFSRIAMYAYAQAGAVCSSITWQNNGSFIYNGNYWWPGDPDESCGTITGANPWFTQTNLQGITLAQLDFPSEIITFVDINRLYYLLEEGMQFRNITGSCVNADLPVLNTIPVPTPNAGADQAIGGTSATLNGSGSTSTNGINYQWLFISGPATPTIVSPFAVTTSVTGMSAVGAYEFLLITTDNSGATRGERTIVNKS